MTAKSDAKRQSALKARRQAQGLVRVSVWVHKDDAQAIKDRALMLNDIRHWMTFPNVVDAQKQQLAHKPQDM